MANILVVAWLILLIAVVASILYREVDGPTVRSQLRENIDLKREAERLQEKSGDLERQLEELTQLKKGLLEEIERLYVPKSCF